MAATDSSPPALRAWIATTAALALAVAAGLGLLWARAQFHGDPDPFNDGWPLFLQAGAFAGALAVTLLVRRPIAAALGLYCGLVAYVLVTGGSEYPMSSCIAMAAHALVPAIAGAFVGYFVASRTREKRP